MLVNHDTNRYDLKVKVGRRTAVIHTTASHPVWDATAHRWVKAAALRHGAHLRTPAGAAAVVLGGHTARVRSGWMWDLTIIGDHDFYVAAATTAILVHNVGGPGPCLAGQAGEAASGITKNTKKILINGRGRIPDELTATSIGEVKNVGYQYLSTQIKDYLKFAQQTQRTFNLYVRSNTALVSHN